MSNLLGVEHFPVSFGLFCFLYPIGSMYGIFTYIWPKFMVNVGKYTIHWAFGYCVLLCFVCSLSSFFPNISNMFRNERSLLWRINRLLWQIGTQKNWRLRNALETSLVKLLGSSPLKIIMKTWRCPKGISFPWGSFSGSMFGGVLGMGVFALTVTTRILQNRRSLKCFTFH